jgi:hypothetical protein
VFKAVEDALKSLKEYALFKFARPRGAANGPHPRDCGNIVVVPMVNAMDRRIKLSSTISAS